MNEHGWQFTIVILSAIVASMVAVTLGMRAPAGGTRPLEGITQTAGSALRQATGSRDYILLTIGFFVCGLQLVFITTHLPTYLQDAGINAEIASWSLALIGLFNIIGAFMCGWLGGIVSKKKTLAIVYLFRGLIIAAFISLPASPAMALFFWGGNGAFMAWHHSADKRIDPWLFWAATFKHALWFGVFIASDRVICRRVAWRHLV
jgi:predicted MFS family arabinose efflux permease